MRAASPDEAGLVARRRMVLDEFTNTGTKILPEQPILVAVEEVVEVSWFEAARRGPGAWLQLLSRRGLVSLGMEEEPPPRATGPGHSGGARSQTHTVRPRRPRAADGRRLTNLRSALSSEARSPPMLPTWRISPSRPVSAVAMSMPSLCTSKPTYRVVEVIPKMRIAPKRSN